MCGDAPKGAAAVVVAAAGLGTLGGVGAWYLRKRARRQEQQEQQQEQLQEQLDLELQEQHQRFVAQVPAIIISHDVLAQQCRDPHNFFLELIDGSSGFDGSSGVPALLLLSFLKPTEAVSLGRVHRLLVSHVRPSSLLRGFKLFDSGCHGSTSAPLSTMLQSLGRSPSRASTVEAVFAEAMERRVEDLNLVIRGTDKNGWPPLLVATQRRHSEAVCALLEMRADADCREPVSGWSPLMYAVTAGDRGTAEVLLKNGAAVNAMAKPHDWNALLAALASNREDMIDLLLDAGADHKSIKCCSGVSVGVADTLRQHVASRKEAQRQAATGFRRRGGNGSKVTMRPNDYFVYC